VIIVGAGIGGLALALSLHRHGIPCRIFEAFADVKPLGVGINLLPHAMRELALLELDEALVEKGVETRDLHFFTSLGQEIYSEPRGRFAGYEWPQVSIHRADLHGVLLAAVQERLGPDAVSFGHRCTGVSQTDERVTVRLATAGSDEVTVQGAIAVACDGVHSAIRKQFHPREAVPRFQGTTMYRGTTRWPAFLSGGSMVYLGKVETGLLILYPIRDGIDAAGRQLVNWVVEVEGGEATDRDWNRTAGVEDFIGRFEHCNFPWLDIPAMLRAADVVLQYPMVDQEPLRSWTEGRVTLLGDAAHPMMPRGSNGAAQALIDAALLGRMLGERSDWPEVLIDYEEVRRPATSNVVLANRSQGPSEIIRLVEQRAGGKPFACLDDVISPAELSAWQERYRGVAGFKVSDLGQGGGRPNPGA
jgi:2-polyprenyl-6-methoxyphenol hydroxylase-like FAD-dependent oxidoreductase